MNKNITDKINANVYRLNRVNSPNKFQFETELSAFVEITHTDDITIPNSNYYVLTDTRVLARLVRV